MTMVIKLHALGYKMTGGRLRMALFPLSLGQRGYAQMPGASIWRNVTFLWSSEL